MKRILLVLIVVVFVSSLCFAGEASDLKITSVVHDPSSVAFSQQPIGAEKWLACENDADCTSVELGCYYWQPVNKKYVSEMKAENVVYCRKSIQAGPQPPSSCLNRVCVNDLFKGKRWDNLEPYQKKELLSGKVFSCLRAAHLETDDYYKKFYHLLDVSSLCQYFVQKVEDSVRKNPSTVDKRLVEMVASFVPCEEVEAKAKSLIDDWIVQHTIHN